MNASESKLEITLSAHEKELLELLCQRNKMNRERLVKILLFETGIIQGAMFYN